MRTATVTCHTSGCPRTDEAVPGVPVTVEDPDGNDVRVNIVICGACGQEITDIEEES